jgi:hypothetical protein
MRFKYVVIVFVAFAAYVLGARAGEERYKQITHAARKYWNDPKLKKARGKAKKARVRAAKAAREKFS